MFTVFLYEGCLLTLALGEGSTGVHYPLLGAFIRFENFLSRKLRKKPASESPEVLDEGGESLAPTQTGEWASPGVGAGNVIL